MTDAAPHSRVLRGKIELAAGPAVRSARSFWEHPHPGEIVPEYLFWIHSLIRASVPLMQEALDRSAALPSSDPVGPPLRAYLGKHIREERNHDEWILDDLEVLGVARADVWRRTPCRMVAEAVGAQYYWIRHVHPVALLGYVAVLEGYPPDRDGLEGVMGRSGLPREAFRTLFKHVHLDVRHSEDLDRALDEMPLSPKQSALVGTSAIRTVQLLGQSLERITAVRG